MPVRFYGGVPRSKARLLPITRKQAERLLILLAPIQAESDLTNKERYDLWELTRRLAHAAEEDSLYDAGGCIDHESR